MKTFSERIDELHGIIKYAEERIKELKTIEEKEKSEKPCANGFVHAVNLSWKIVYGKETLEGVIKPEECRFIGTIEECEKFIADNISDYQHGQ
jgi:hypothetical protein